MERIFEEILPQAKKWSLRLFIISAISFVFQLYGLFFLRFGVSNLIGLIIQGFFSFFLFSYYRACRQGIDDESEENLEEACRHQKNIFLMYGIQAALLMIFGVIGFIAAIIIPLSRF